MKLKLLLHFFIVAAGIAQYASASDPSPAQPEPTAADSTQAAGKHDVHWSYQGEAAPDQWGGLKPEFAACKEGKTQSPIDISQVKLTPLPSIEFHYKSSPLKIINNGHTIQVNYQAGSYIKVGDARYDLLQFHFHNPSEHMTGSKSSPMEVHLVHKTATGQLGVIGVLMQQGNVHSLVNKIWSHLPQHEGKEESKKMRVNAADFLPKNKTYFNYIGSLTTPPCSENVNWMVLTTPIQVSKQQITQFNKIFPISARPVQPINDRVVNLSY